MTPTTRVRAKLRPERLARRPDAPSELERSSASRVKPLRRWSVAELVAHATVRPPKTA